jgi:hypothetical protein
MKETLFSLFSTKGSQNLDDAAGQQHGAEHQHGSHFQQRRDADAGYTKNQK